MPVLLGGTTGVHGPDEVAAVDEDYRALGFVVLRGVLSEDGVDRVEAECATAQREVVEGRVGARYGSTVYTREATGEPVVDDVEHVTGLSPAAAALAGHPDLVGFAHRHLGGDARLRDDEGAGVVYSDPHAGHASACARAGWHSEWQCAPSRDDWPSCDFTLHVDGTGPANGFLRAVPGSQRWATPAPWPDRSRTGGTVVHGGHTDEPPPYAMPRGVERLPGEVALYLERGDLLLQDAYLWHCAARASDDGARRRHLRGSWAAR